MNLIIVESPTKARTIKRFLDKNNKVLATKGHIRDLPKSRMGIDTDTFEPEYITIRGKGEVLNELKKNAKKADNIYIATDNDREGEAIAWHVAKVLGIEGKKNRIEFNEITKKAIVESIKNPRTVDGKLVDSQQARRMVDRLVGYGISPLLWKKVKNKLSAGRVQSVALMIICEREEAILAFVPEEYWTIKGNFPFEDEILEMDLKQVIIDEKIKPIKISTEDEKDTIINTLKKGRYTVLSNEKRSRNKKPYPPFTTSQMQQEANKRLNFKSAQTMRIAQTLYEGVDIGLKGRVGLITYMRTDSTRISDEAAKKCGEFIEQKYGKNYYNGVRNYSNKKKNTQDAHEAIRPTDVSNTPAMIKAHVSDQEYKLYRLIWNRFVQSQMADAKISTAKLSVVNGTYIFKAEFKELIFDGFMKVDGVESGFTETDISKLKKGVELTAKSVKGTQNFTKPPARYTEATLIKTLEEEGIGRPSTYAPIISTLSARHYIKIERKSISPTDLGMLVNTILKESFPSIINVKFTAKMEDQLDEISLGNKEWKKVLQDFYADFRSDLDKAEDEIKKIEIKDEVSETKCDQCGRMMVFKQGPFGKFLACPGFPECKNTKSIVEGTGVSCPNCKKGEIIKKKSKRGRIFYGCDQYPECEYIAQNKPIKETCPKCNSMLTEKNYASYKLIQCSACDFEEKRAKESTPSSK
ncbi:MAG: type I DNA topoisomerase [Tissierellia bacterium]|nr:type I DNA topoisomerase [Tissierellia bacterium]